MVNLPFLYVNKQVKQSSISDNRSYMCHCVDLMATLVQHNPPTLVVGGFMGNHCASSRYHQWGFRLGFFRATTRYVA